MAYRVRAVSNWWLEPREGDEVAVVSANSRLVPRSATGNVVTDEHGRRFILGRLHREVASRLPGGATSVDSRNPLRSRDSIISASTAALSDGVDLTAEVAPESKFHDETSDGGSVSSSERKLDADDEPAPRPSSASTASSQRQKAQSLFSPMEARRSLGDDATASAEDDGDGRPPSGGTPTAFAGAVASAGNGMLPRGRSESALSIEMVSDLTATSPSARATRDLHGKLVHSTSTRWSPRSSRGSPATRTGTRNRPRMSLLRTVSDELTHSPDLTPKSARDKYRVEKDGCDVLDLDEELAACTTVPPSLPRKGSWTDDKPSPEHRPVPGTPPALVHPATASARVGLDRRRVRLGSTAVIGTREGVRTLRLDTLPQPFSRVFSIGEDLGGGANTPTLKPPKDHHPTGPSTAFSPTSSAFFPPEMTTSKPSLATRVLDDLCQPFTWEPPEAFSPAPVSAVDMRELCLQVHAIVREEPTVVETNAPIKVFGDIHGQFSDLLSFFAVHGTPYPPIKSDIQGFRYLFNGDFVDRGPHSLEVVALLFALKVRFPEQVILLRGNHESSELNQHYGFHEECVRRYKRGEGALVWRIINRVFHALPLAAVLDKRILVVHGGIGPSLRTLDDIARLPRETSIPDGGSGLVELMWSDPATDDGEAGYKDNEDRGCGVVFGADMVREFRKRNALDMIIRSHEPVGDGFEWFDEGHLVTVFSAVRYTGTRENAGAFLLVDNTLKVEPRMIPPEFDRLGFRRGSFTFKPEVPQHRPPTPERT